MKTKIVYCIVSSSTDYYYEQLIISLTSLRKYNEDAIVQVVCDYETYNTFTGNRTLIFSLANDITPIETPNNWKNFEKSRFLKTNLRRLVKGDYLFLDTDTIICDTLVDVDSFTCDIGAVYDSHVNRALPRLPTLANEFWICAEAIRVGVDITGMVHFNSGVFYVKDSTNAHELYSRWWVKYQECLSRGAFLDQLPLTLANNELGDIIRPLNPKFNCQVITEDGKNILQSAIIIHYMPSKKRFFLSDPWILAPLKQIGTIPPTIMQIIDNPYDFFKEDSRIIMGGTIENTNFELVKWMEYFLTVAYENHNKKAYNIVADSLYKKGKVFLAQTHWGTRLTRRFYRYYQLRHIFSMLTKYFRS